MAAMDLVFGYEPIDPTGLTVGMRRRPVTLNGVLVVTLAWAALAAAILHPLSGLALMALGPLLLRTRRPLPTCQN
jgi:hypothetical protein